VCAPNHAFIEHWPTPCTTPTAALGCRYSRRSLTILHARSAGGAASLSAFRILRSTGTDRGALTLSDPAFEVKNAPVGHPDWVCGFDRCVADRAGGPFALVGVAATTRHLSSYRHVDLRSEWSVPPVRDPSARNPGAVGCAPCSALNSLLGSPGAFTANRPRVGEIDTRRDAATPACPLMQRLPIVSVRRAPCPISVHWALIFLIRERATPFAGTPPARRAASLFDSRGTHGCEHASSP